MRGEHFFLPLQTHSRQNHTHPLFSLFSPFPTFIQAQMDSKGRTSGSYLDDDSIREDNPLMSQNAGAKRPATRRWLNGRTIFTTLNLALFLTGISVWSQVAMLVKTKNLSCKAIANSAGEADCEYNSLYSKPRILIESSGIRQ